MDLNVKNIFFAQYVNDRHIDIVQDTEYQCDNPHFIAHQAQGFRHPGYLLPAVQAPGDIPDVQQVIPAQQRIINSFAQAGILHQVAEIHKTVSVALPAHINGYKAADGKISQVGKELIHNYKFRIFRKN